MRVHLALATAMLLAGCGGDDDGGGAADGGGASADASTTADAGAADASAPDAGNDGDAGTPGKGSAVIRGTIDGQTVEPQSAWYTSFPLGNAFVLAMPEDERVCDAINPGEGLTALIDFSCGAARDIEYPVIDDPTIPCDPEKPHAFVRVEGIDGPVPEVIAENGTVTVDAVDDTAVVGSFTAGFGTLGFLSGSFNASICPEPK